MRLSGSVTRALCLVGATLCADAAVAIECAEMTNARVAATRITAATVITPNPAWQSPPNFTTGNQPVAVRVTFCRVEAVIDKEIVFELWLPPAQSWNGRYLGVGNGGDAGFINY